MFRTRLISLSYAIVVPLFHTVVRSIVIAGSIFPMEEVAEKQSADARKNHIRRLREGKCTIELGFVQSDLLTSMESIVDHCSNVAETVISYR